MAISLPCLRLCHAQSDLRRFDGLVSLHHQPGECRECREWREEKQSSSSGWVSANRGEGPYSALLQSRIGFRETTSGRVVGAWDVGPTVVGVRILRVKLSQKLRNKNCDAN